MAELLLLALIVHLTCFGIAAGLQIGLDYEDLPWIILRAHAWPFTMGRFIRLTSRRNAYDIVAGRPIRREDDDAD